MLRGNFVWLMVTRVGGGVSEGVREGVCVCGCASTCVHVSKLFFDHSHPYLRQFHRTTRMRSMSAVSTRLPSRRWDYYGDSGCGGHRW